ncbi:hypothetical protein PoB_005529600 [Plakobranchus ocellatus]|uniref:Uncharacterized protein n=1 Tax=Plakobranchus ocellatus TaxID=259542 RepID=A0AAV4C7X0_9GAST|nr:hypothetical protein PoB_005529600 [Plakobranchus ocellatus]
MVAPANLTKEEKELFYSASMDVDDEENTDEQTENDGDECTAPSTSTATWSALKAAIYDSTNATIIDEPLCLMSSPVSAIHNLCNASEYYRTTDQASFKKGYPLEQFSSPNAIGKSQFGRGTMATYRDGVSHKMFKAHHWLTDPLQVLQLIAGLELKPAKDNQCKIQGRVSIHNSTSPLFNGKREAYEI